MTSPFPCCPVNRGCSWKKTLIEKKKNNFPLEVLVLREVSKYGVYFYIFLYSDELNTEIYGVKSVFSSNTGKYGPEKTPYLDTFYALRHHPVNIPSGFQ